MHKNFNKYLRILLSIALILASLSPTALAETSSNPWNRYFGGQLTSDARIFYDAMVRMYESGMLQSGAESLDLVAAGYLSQGKVEAYMNAANSYSGALLNDFGAARDAFWADYPSAFYVDFSNLSVRVDGNSHVWIGTGRTDNYFTQGFTSSAQVVSAINEYNAALATLIEGTKTVTPRAGQSFAAAQVEYVHDALTHGVSYRFEDSCKSENRGFLSTAYGALIKHEAVCEGYTRAFKAAMDALNIPCVMVNGVYLHNPDTPEAHIWNYVQLDGQWYGVDATMDDPKPKTPAATAGVDGYESKEYLLRGEVVMGQKHVTSGILSSAGYNFHFPSLSITDYGISTVTDDDGFNVAFKQDGNTGTGTAGEGVAAGEFYISYHNMGCAAAREAGVWFLERFWSEDENGELAPDGWHYILTDVYNLDDHETYLHLAYPQVQYVQFAVTRVSPGPYLEDPYTYMWYVGDASAIGPTSALIENENSGYKAPPYPASVTPTMTEKMVISNQTYHVTVDYNDDLVRDPAYESIGIRMEATAYNRTITNIEQRASIANVRWDGKRRVSFDFTPSEYYADDAIFYDLTPTGLVGAKSGKVPIAVTYGAGHTSSYCSLGVGGFNWRVFAQPTLIDEDISMQGWKLSDGSTPSELLKSRLTLVASTTSPSQTEAMNGMLGPDVLSSQTYNIQLTLCDSCIAQIGDGQSIRVALGFPAGYGPNDAGVTFKAYHFRKDASGNITGVEEIPCIITPYGLIIECSSFSPFAVAAVADQSATPLRSAILTSTAGGALTSDSGSSFSLSPGATATIRAQADPGYTIETLTFNGTEIPAAKGQRSYALTFSYNDLSATTGSIIHATFLPDSVRASDAQSGETPTTPGTTPPDDPSPSTPSQPITVPKTGDTETPLLWLLMTLTPAAALLIKRRARNK